MTAIGVMNLKYLIKSDIGRDIEILEKQRQNPEFNGHGFSQKDPDELIGIV